MTGQLREFLALWAMYMQVSESKLAAQQPRELELALPQSLQAKWYEN